MTLDQIMHALGNSDKESTLIILTNKGRITLKEGASITNINMAELRSWVGRQLK